MRICLSDLPGDICNFLIECEAENFIPSCGDLFEAFDEATAEHYAYELQLPDIREELEGDMNDTEFGFTK